MRRFMVVNKSNRRLLAENVRAADSFFGRLKGLLGKRGFSTEDGLILFPCSMVHTIGMKTEIDVLFLSAIDEIVYVIEKMQPNRISPYVKASRYVVELPAGQVARTCTTKGHVISITQIY